MAQVKDRKPITKLRDAPWLKVRLDLGKRFHQTAQALGHGDALNTVCVEAACPNRHECWSAGTATFMILGDTCTRACKFCNVKTGKPASPDPHEPKQLAEAARTMGIRYCVITSVDRDDLPDKGAEHFGLCMDALREAVPGIRIELLTPDFKHQEEQAIERLKLRAPFIWGHNIETVPRLYQTARRGSSYEGSLRLLRLAGEIHESIKTKSSLMVGLGETQNEVVDVMRDLHAQGVRRMNIGQYLRPTRQHLEVVEYHPPEYFDELKAAALEIGFKVVRSGPLVRSSYHAHEDGE
ncbi:lipoyl synthase [Candidatus Sumerlaeota bacterium]|nr:lipoyl synthase [Candidatus Sumerlaeota bacterium]